MDRRQYLVLVGSAATASRTVSAANDHSSNESDGGDESVHDIADDELYQISNLDELAALPFDPNVAAEFTGEGSRVTDEFELEHGLMMFVYESEVGDYEGLEADLEQTDGDYSVGWVIFDILFGEDTEVVTGGSVETVERGAYLLDVSSPGEWAISVAQPQSPEEEVRSLPVSVTGEHSTIVGPFEANNGVTLAGEHRDPDSDSTFDVLVFEEDSGDLFGMDYAFMEESGFEGEARADIDGVSWAHVQTRGEWSLEFEN
ncbi:hypothetical protein [Haloterrigena alkaliphila]|uniref:Uncharacterized protein n=1 Tax=Haloterrigena alkaliphila TaxID=2816475 RepID=A0A8A2VCX3_9EURY|nr:hypothetical protein [Haloterrigena alkaliphila]QSW99046.1 hypothetical protein J0X25_16950 [Haloterrigena alkaliphila]